MEELCCCLKENAFLLGTDIMQDSLLKFISNECDVPQLARELYPLVHKRGNLSTFVTMILEYVGFYSPEEIRQVEKVLKQGANLPDYEKQKIQIDYMVEKFQSFDAMCKQIEEQAYSYFGVYDNGELCGYFAVKPENDECFFLSKLYLRKDKRGKRSYDLRRREQWKVRLSST